MLTPLRERIEASASENPWLPRALVLAWFVWIWMGFFGSEPPSYFRNPFGAATLIVHESGHAAFMWSGNELLTVMGGTIFQILIPVLVAYFYWHKQDVFAVAILVFWLGTSLVDAGTYAADARAQALPLVSPWGDGEDVGHDWTFMLMRFGKLSRDQIIGGRLRAAGMLLMPLSLLAGAWIVSVLAGAPRRADRFSEEDRIHKLIER
jgi:hypothetical protein